MDSRLQDAVSLWRNGRHTEAEQVCNEILAANGAHLDARGLLAEVYSSGGRFQDAAVQLRLVADHQPDDAATHRRLGDAFYASMDYANAVESFRRAISLQPANPRAHNNLGRALAALKDHATAVESYRAALALDPRYAIAHINLGVSLSELEALQDAAQCYERAIALNPRLVQAHVNQGNLQFRSGAHDRALESYSRALAIDANNAAIHCYRANALRELHRLEDSLTSYDSALQLQPDMLDGLRGKAFVLQELARHEQAVACCDDLIAKYPDIGAGWLYRGLALMDLKRYAEAAQSLERLIEIAPDQSYGQGYLLFAKQYACDWTLEPLAAAILDQLKNSKPLTTPLAMLAATDNPALQLLCARTRAEHSHLPARQPLCTRAPRARAQKIRVAYLSADLRDHALSYLMAGVFEKHDRSRFEVFGISFQEPGQTPFGTRVLKSFDAFVDISRQSDAQTAEMLHRMEIDIGVDLMSYTRAQRLNIFGHRFAPVQVGYLGFPGTSGTPYIDYLLADEVVIPPNSRQHYSEAVVYMPDCFQANDDQRVLGGPAPTRAAVGLPEQAFVFCSFNSCYKITAPVFDSWCRLLRGRPDSVLWILTDNPDAQRNLTLEAAARGIDPARLIFAGRIQYEDHLARLRLADLFLDSFPFSAGATASDALWAGVPVVTRPGDSFASRMAASLLKTLGLPELVAEGPEEYERIATQLATDPAGLAALRERLATLRHTSALFNTERFTRHLESAYETMYETSIRGEPPVAFAVADSSSSHGPIDASPSPFAGDPAHPRAGPVA
jgi:protein O-GlcNAc transferase